MDVVEEKLAAIDAKIARLHAHAQARDTDEFASLLALAQIDDLLEQRHRLTRPTRPPATAATSES